MAGYSGVTATYLRCSPKLMTEPPSRKAEPAKQAALSATKLMEPKVVTRPVATRSPSRLRDPVQNVTPDAVSSPPVGAKCHGMDKCLSIGLCVGAADTAGGICRRDWAQT